MLAVSKVAEPGFYFGVGTGVWDSRIFEIILIRVRNAFPVYFNSLS